MQRIAIIVPFPNIAVEYEFHKMIKNALEEICFNETVYNANNS